MRLGDRKGLGTEDATERLHPWAAFLGAEGWGRARGPDPLGATLSSGREGSPPIPPTEVPLQGYPASAQGLTLLISPANVY